MKTFKVLVEWVMVHEVDVIAETLEDAIRMVQDDQIDIDVDNDGEYLSDSFQVNEDATFAENQND